MMTKVKLALLCMQRYSWEQGVAMQALFESGDMAAVIALSKEAAYRALPDGRLAVIGTPDTVTDPCAGGEALLACVKATGDMELQKAADSLLHWALEGAPRSEAGIVYHRMTGREFWVDSMYMLPPYLAAAGHPKEAFRQLKGYWTALYNPQSGLIRHIYCEETQTFIRDAHWGVGNGWAIAAMARMMALLPKDMEKEREWIRERAVLLIDKLAAHMLDDGYFHDIVDDPASFVETNLTQMLSFALLKGMTDKWLPITLLPLAEKLRNAALKKVDRFGFVQDVCGAPTFDKPGVAPEGQSFFLMMEAAYKRLKSS